MVRVNKGRKLFLAKKNKQYDVMKVLANVLQHVFSHVIYCPIYTKLYCIQEKLHY